LLPEPQIRAFLAFVNNSAERLSKGDAKTDMPQWFTPDLNWYESDERNANDASSILGRYQIFFGYF
jgi:hypothetical protein